MAAIEIRLEADDSANGLIQPGDVFADDPDFGVVVEAYRLGDRLYVKTDLEYDYLGLPSTVVVERA